MSSSSKPVGRGRGVFAYKKPQPGSFLEGNNFPIPAIWAAKKESTEISNETVTAPLTNITNAANGLGNSNGHQGNGSNGQFDDADPKREVLNPEEKLEVANHVIGEYQRDEEPEIPTTEETPESCNARSFTFTKLHFDPKLSQEKRREFILGWQKKRRDELVDKIRHFENDNWSDDEMDENNDFVKIQEKRRHQQQQTGEHQWHGRYTVRPTGRRWNDHARVMVSEWMSEKPEDFEDKWLGVFCPVGVRCLLFASRGKTRVITRRGYFIGEFQSRLPSGRKFQRHQGSMDAPARGVTILDCIWSEESQTFYMLDILCWNSLVCTDYDTECRQFLLKSKLDEIPDLMEKSEVNPFPFKPLTYFPADELPSVMSIGSPPFPEKVDGVLFFHRRTFYIYESSNPLCLWTHLSKVPEMLGTDVNPDLLSREREPKPPRTPRPRGRGNLNDSMEVVREGAD